MLNQLSRFITLGFAGELKGRLNTDEIVAAWQSKRTFGQSKGGGSILASAQVQCGVRTRRQKGLHHALSCGLISGAMQGILTGSSSGSQDLALDSGTVRARAKSPAPAEAQLAWPGQNMNYLVKSQALLDPCSEVTADGGNNTCDHKHPVQVEQTQSRER